MAPKIVLGYWEARGLAQPIRLLLEYTGVEWEDKLYSCGSAPDIDQTSWFEVKDSLGFDFPNLPYLIDGNVKLTQTEAILRYLARRHGLFGSTEEEESRVDLVAAEWADFNRFFVNLCQSPKFEENKQYYFKEVLQFRLEKFSDFLDHRSYFAGENITFVDFMMYEVFSQHKFIDPGSLSCFENLQDFMDRIENLKRIKAYIKSPRFIKYPLNNRMAYFDFLA